MKKLFILFILLSSAVVMAQRDKDDEIVYYEDSQVRPDRFMLGLVGNPTYTDRRLINDEIPAGGGFDLVDDNAGGGFNFNYEAQVFYRLGSSLDLGTGFGREYATFDVENVSFYLDADNTVIADSVQTDVETDVEMWVVPVMLNFNTAISDVFTLEVVPTVKLTFIDSYVASFDPAEGESFTRDFTDETRDLNWQVGLSLGGTYYFTESWGFFLHINGRYMLNSMVELDNFPRETIYQIGTNLGLKYRF